MNDSDTRGRIDRLEEQIAHQEKSLEDLNEVVTRQADLIDALTLQLRRLSEHVEEIEDLSANPTPVARPPHY
ncbi:SlyX family protein [Stappia sp.]|uniref:SlyX family protein n=1 Tax=Stappia sp. TaxID=1870903 RepID=UPI003A98DCFD